VESLVITVVSGLPRSGTSLIMQMLAAGGHPILTDQVRQADPDNPRGYLEYEPVKALERDQSWLVQAERQAIKVVSPLLTKLPGQFQYQVIFLRRDLDEILRSQDQMLQRRGQPAGPSADLMKSHFERHLKSLEDWLAKQSNFQVLYCCHADLIRNPRITAEQIAAFLACNLDVNSMQGVVDPTLHRQRTTG